MLKELTGESGLTFSLRSEAVMRLHGIIVVQDEGVAQDVRPQVDRLHRPLERSLLSLELRLEQGSCGEKNKRLERYRGELVS